MMSYGLPPLSVGSFELNGTCYKAPLAVVLHSRVARDAIGLAYLEVPAHEIVRVLEINEVIESSDHSDLPILDDLIGC